jgi:hypothetical protein
VRAVSEPPFGVLKEEGENSFVVISYPMLFKLHF